MPKSEEDVRAYYTAFDALSAISSDPWLDSWMPRRLSRRAGYALAKNDSAAKPKLTWQETAKWLRECAAQAYQEMIEGKMPHWKFYRNGKIVPISEEEARHTFDRWNTLSDDRGAALLMIEQLWAEIDRLRALA